MSEVEALRQMFAYSDERTRALLAAAGPVDAAGLDRPFEMGFGSLRRTLEHIEHGDRAWLGRWRGEVETAWPKFDSEASPSQIEARLAIVSQDRDAFLATLTNEALDERQTYRDSRGTLYHATLRQMLYQALIHATHHRAQATNMLRQITGTGLEMDYMVTVRQPVEGDRGADATSGGACSI